MKVDKYNLSVLRSLVAAAGLAGACGGAAAAAQSAQAAAAPDEASGDIVVVTARRRAESLQETPISITAFNEEALELRNIDDVSDVADYTPNFNFITSTGIGGSSTAFAFIRGIGQPEVFVQNDPGVGVYVDGVYLGRSQGAVLDTLALERVEVLRGPQGTLFGRNTIGGAVNLISRKPTAEPHLEAQLEVGNYNMVNALVRAGGALSDTVFVSGSVSQRSHDGFAEADPHPACFSCTEADLNDADTLSARAALRWIPNNAFTFDLAADVTQKDALPIARRLAFYDASPMLDPLFFLPGGYAGAVMSGWGVGPEAFVNREENTHSSNFAGEDDQSIWGVSATAEWEGEHLTLRSITGYRELDIDHAADGDGSPLALNTVVAETTDQDQFSQEFQLLGTTADGRLDWLAGAFYFEETATNAIAQALTFTEAGQIVPAPPPNPPMVIDCFDASAPPLFGCPARPTLVSSLDVTNYAFFAHASFALTDQVSVSAGLRYSDEEKDFTGADANGAPLDLSDSWDALTPSLTLEWAPSETLFFYASYSEGFKSGTFNNGNDPAQPRSVTPEEVEAYEVGARASWLDGDLTLSLAAFDNTYTGQQLQVPTSNFTFAFVNVASSEIQGLELEFAARPHETLTIDGSVGYLDTEITDVLVGTPGVREGARLVRSPEWTFNAGFTFETSIGSLGRMQLRGDYIYRTEQEGDFTNHPNVRTDAYSTVNARLAYVPPNERLEFALWGRNVFDQSYESARASIAPQLFAVAVDGPPRVWGVSASVRY